MRVLGLLGSPRRRGNTETLLDRALAGAAATGAATEKIVLNELIFRPCQECPDAPTDGSCLLADELQPVYRAVAGAAAVILASPVFFGSVSAQTKMMIDRWQCPWAAVHLHRTLPPPPRRPGAFLAVSAQDRPDFFTNARAVAKNWFVAAGLEYAAELYGPGLEGTDAAAGRPELLARAFTLGEALARSVPR